jgi:hypothetical protein
MNSDLDDVDCHSVVLACAAIFIPLATAGRVGLLLSARCSPGKLVDIQCHQFTTSQVSPHQQHAQSQPHTQEADPCSEKNTE